VSRKHIEIIVKQMFSRRKITLGGDTNLTEGMIVDELHLPGRECAKAKEKGGTPAKAESVVMGIADVSLSRKSFLSAASFQHTTRVLINSAVRGSEDDLVGLMENIIIGRLIPAGTGFKGSPKQKLMETVQPTQEEIDEAGY
jgi:DNA-directed RNA polymerase subunit beta'